MQQNTAKQNPQNEAEFLNQGIFYEQQRNFKKAFEIYKQALEHFPGAHRLHLQLAMLHLGNDEKDEAVKHFSQYFAGNNDIKLETVQLYGSLVEEVAGIKKAIDCYKELNAKLKSPVIDHVIQKLKKDGKSPQQNQVEIETAGLNFSTTTVADLFSFFSGRENNYAIQWEKDNNIGYSPANEPLGFQTAARHLKGEITLGIYQLNAAAQVKWCAFDVDIKKEQVQTREDEGKNINFLLYQALTAAKEIKCAVNSRGLKSYIEFSGNKGYHVWIFWEDFISARKAKDFMADILNQVDLGVLDKIISVETFPKQVSLTGQKKLGNLIKLPFGIHKKTGKRSYFLDKNDEPLAEPSDFFHLAEKNTIEQLNKSSQVQETGDNETAPAEVSDMVKDSSITMSDPDFNLLISKCRIIDYIVNKILWEKECSDDEFTIIKHTVGHLRNGQKLVNELLLNLKNANENLKLKKNLTGYPVGCKKIRQKVPDIAVRFDCTCKFSPDLKEYQHPVLHVKEFKMEQEELSEQKVEALKFQQHLEKFIETKKEIKEKVDLVKSLENYLNKYLDEKKVEELKTEFGVLRRITHPNGDVSLMMEL